MALDGTRLATGRDFGEDGELSREDVVRLDEAGAFGLVDRLEGADFSVRSVEEKPWKRSPYPPFLTSTLQQEAGRKLRFTAARTMRVAQDLYELVTERTRVPTAPHCRTRPFRLLARW